MLPPSAPLTAYGTRSLPADEAAGQSDVGGEGARGKGKGREHSSRLFLLLPPKSNPTVDWIGVLAASQRPPPLPQSTLDQAKLIGN